MARINHVKKARKDQGACGYCHKPIVAGDAYVWVALRSGPYYKVRKRRHAACPRFRQSDLTLSKMSGVYLAGEDLEDTLSGGVESKEDVENALTEWADAVRSVAEEYEESATNMEDGFGHETYQSQELREKAEALEAWADDYDSVLSGADDPDEATCDEHDEYDEDCEDCEDARQDALDNLVEEAISYANDIPI